MTVPDVLLWSVCRRRIFPVFPSLPLMYMFTNEFFEIVAIEGPPRTNSGGDFSQKSLDKLAQNKQFRQGSVSEVKDVSASHSAPQNHFQADKLLFVSSHLIIARRRHANFEAHEDKFPGDNHVRQIVTSWHQPGSTSPKNGKFIYYDSVIMYSSADAPNSISNCACREYFLEVVCYW